ncbi:MAG: hypothetical protein Q9186_006762 [Xanthomendoza sp. 1 TL-2023]
MSASRPDTGRGRTKTAKQELDSDSDESDTTASQAGRTFSNAVPGTFKYRSRVNEYNNNVEFPLPPLYAVNELVYLEMPGQAQPAGPYQNIEPSWDDIVDALSTVRERDQLVELEQKLEEQDAGEQTPYHLSSRRDDRNSNRTALIAEIEAKLPSYDEALQLYYRQIERPRPSRRNIESVARWLEGNKPLIVSESSFLDDWNDLVAPTDHSDYGRLDAAIANFGNLLYRWGLPMFLTSKVAFPPDQSKPKISD